MISLRTEVYIDFDDVTMILQRPDVVRKKQKYIDSTDRTMYEKANEIIEEAKATGKYYNIAGRDENVRSILVMKSGMVIGCNNNPETIIKRYAAETRAQKSQAKRTKGRSDNKG